MCFMLFLRSEKNFLISSSYCLFVEAEIFAQVLFFTRLKATKLSWKVEKEPFFVHNFMIRIETFFLPTWWSSRCWLAWRKWIGFHIYMKEKKIRWKVYDLWHGDEERNIISHDDDEVFSLKARVHFIALINAWW